MNKKNNGFDRIATEMFLISAMQEYYRIYWDIVKKGPKEAFNLLTDNHYMETVYDQVIERAKKGVAKNKSYLIDFEGVRMEVMTLHTKALVLAYM
ncbi:TPA: hypothetical protein L0X66_001348 [Citrobacter freundii]|jgi:hypothetical protein|uniref:hypothetical protein n=1 Tax=Citrobacter freundii TaxID=546 RepID=UPI0015EA9C93|nr:hypothetical protein [Citrobacter freundii]QLX26729.1 hypothetical protein HV271_18825 [Citrobacter freundii]HBM9257033.1 hypothetical protein [Citrobacter freundii]